MTIANTVAAKLAVAFVAVAMIFTLVLPVQAQDADADLQSVINGLMAQIADLQAKLGQGGESMMSTSDVCPYTWTRSLNTGDSGSDVMMLQKYLNGSADTRVAATGAGSAGQETEFYGPATAGAVSKFQTKYSADILVPNGLVNPTGFFGPSTMAKANAKCAAAPAPVVDPAEPADEEEEEEDNGPVSLQGEGTLDDSETDMDEDETEVAEGAEESVAIITLSAEDGDLEVDRMEFVIVDATPGTANDENDPWDAFDEFMLQIDGETVGSFDASDEDEYLDEDAGTFRFTKLGLVLPEDEDVEMEFVVAVANSVDGADTSGTSADWSLDFTDLRFFDADGVSSDETVAVSAAEFEIEEEGSDDDADLESSSDDPDATTLLVDDNSQDSDEFTVFIFDIDVDEESSDLILEDAYLDVTIANPATAGAAITGGQEQVIKNIYMTVDGNTETGDASTALDNEDASIAIGASTQVQYEFEFNEIELKADNEYEVTVTVVLEGQDGNYENGVTIQVQADSQGTTAWEVEGLEDDNVLTGADTSETHVLASVVPVITNTSFEEDRNEAGDAGTISFEFNMEADGENDLTFTFGDVAEVDGTTDDLRFSLQGTDTTIASSSISLLSGDATPTGTTGWTIADGDDATFILDVTFTTVDANDNGTYRVTIDTIEGLEIDETSGGLNLTN